MKTSRALILDNDVVLDPACPDRLQHALDKRTDAVLAMPRVLYAQDPDTIQYDGAESHFLGLMTLLHAGQPVEAAPTETREIDSLVSACFLIDQSRCGGDLQFNEPFFMYLEDHEFGLRARLRGHVILSVPEARCFHGGGTPGLALRTTGQYHPLRVRRTIENRWRLFLVLYQPHTFVVLGPALALFELFQLVGAIKKGWFMHWIRSVVAILRAFPQILKSRQVAQRLRRVPDRSVLSGGPIPFSVGMASSVTERFATGFLESVVACYWRMARGFL